MTELSRRDLLKGASAVAMVSATLPALAKAVPATDPFIERLIAKMSIQDKAGQLSIYSDPLATRTEGPVLNPGLAKQGIDELKARIRRAAKADPADVAEQSVDVPDDAEDEREP